MNYFTFKHKDSDRLYSAQRDIGFGDKWIVMWQVEDKCRYIKYHDNDVDYYILKGIWELEENVKVSVS